MPDSRYPIGKFEATPNPSEADLQRWVGDIEALPARMREAVSGFTLAQWEAPYREGGWTARQVVHHVADSHMQSYGRFKLALTEVEPVIKPYEEGQWAELADTRLTPPETSLVLLEALHQRWTVLLRSLSDEQWQRAFRHPELGVVGLVKAADLYSWHGRHHTAHITLIKPGLSQRF